MAKVLLIEDDESIAGIYKTAIEIEGNTVDVAKDGQDGLAKATSKKYDLIILDIVLPNMSGLDLLRKIKTDKLQKKCKVIMLTNYGQQENIKKAYDLGAAEVLLKYRLTPSEAAAKVKELVS